MMLRMLDSGLSISARRAGDTVTRIGAARAEPAMARVSSE